MKWTNNKKSDLTKQNPKPKAYSLGYSPSKEKKRKEKKRKEKYQAWVKRKFSQVMELSRQFVKCVLWKATDTFKHQAWRRF